MLDELMTVEECAALLRVSISTVRKNTKEMPHLKLGARVLFSRPDISKWLESKRRMPKAASMSKYQEVRERLRSLKTEHTATPTPRKVG